LSQLGTCRCAIISAESDRKGELLGMIDVRRYIDMSPTGSTILVSTDSSFRNCTFFKVPLCALFPTPYTTPIDDRENEVELKDQFSRSSMGVVYGVGNRAHKGTLKNVQFLKESRYLCVLYSLLRTLRPLTTVKIDPSTPLHGRDSEKKRYQMKDKDQTHPSLNAMTCQRAIKSTVSLRRASESLP
jgi:hypothetical protein